MDEETARKIWGYRQEIAALLRERPELVALQDRINKTLAGAGNSHNRCVIISMMMKEKLAELGEAMKLLPPAAMRYAQALANKAQEDIARLEAMADEIKQNTNQTNQPGD